MTRASFAHIARNSPELQILRLFHSRGPHCDEWLKAVAEHCPALQELILARWFVCGSADGLLSVAERCHQLNEIEIIKPFDIPGAAFCAAISQCARLRRFFLNRAVTDGVLHALSKCHFLEEVELTDAPQALSEGSVIALVDGCPALELLTLPEGAEITMDVVRAVSRCCPFLASFACPLSEALEERREEIAALLPNCNFS
jgi:hypothetical protein